LSCDPERVTALVDGVLEGAERAEVESHLSDCGSCQKQAVEERDLRVALRGIPSPYLPPGLDERVRHRIARADRPRLGVVARRLLPLAAVLLAGFWFRGSAGVVAWELSRDHDHCFSKPKLPAQVWSADPSVVAEWFADGGTDVPLLPGSAGRLNLVGARRCPLPDLSRAPHVYYASARGELSAFVVPHGVRLDGDFVTRSRGNAVALVRVGGGVVGIVGEDPDDVDAFISRLRTSVATLDVASSR